MSFSGDVSLPSPTQRRILSCAENNTNDMGGLGLAGLAHVLGNEIRLLSS